MHKRAKAQHQIVNTAKLLYNRRNYDCDQTYRKATQKHNEDILLPFPELFAFRILNPLNNTNVTDVNRVSFIRSAFVLFNIAGLFRFCFRSNPFLALFGPFRDFPQFWIIMIGGLPVDSFNLYILCLYMRWNDILVSGMRNIWHLTFSLYFKLQLYIYLKLGKPCWRSNSIRSFWESCERWISIIDLTIDTKLNEHLSMTFALDFLKKNIIIISKKIEKTRSSRGKLAHNAQMSKWKENLKPNCDSMRIP